MSNNKIRPIAIYLPQYHPIPENDEWWGKGFTEWTNVTKAKPLFKGHHQPNLPGELGFYDLRVPEVREQQAALAREHGIEGFMYWHYWFGNGKRLLERPFNEVLESGKPDFPFCLGWANETWSGIWHGLSDRILMEQTYPGVEDYQKHFCAVLSAFKDKRYITVDGKPAFLIYRPLEIPDSKIFINQWNTLAVENGLKGIHFIGLFDDEQGYKKLADLGFDSMYLHPQMKTVSIMFDNFQYRLKRKLYKNGFYKNFTNKGVFEYKDYIQKWFNPVLTQKENVCPVLLPNWDNSPRSGKNSLILKNSTPELWRQHIKETFNAVKNKKEEHRIVFIKSWNEWAEGNYLEPDRRYGKRYLEVLKEEIDKFNNL